MFRVLRSVFGGRIDFRAFVRFSQAMNNELSQEEMARISRKAAFIINMIAVALEMYFLYLIAKPV